MGAPIRIVMFVGWKVRKCIDPPADLQPPDYNCRGKAYWFFRHLNENIELDVVDNSCSFGLWELIERKMLHCYIWQIIKSFKVLRKYDLIISHGAQSGIGLAFVRSLIGGKLPPHLIIDIGSLNGGRDKKGEIALFRFAMRSVKGLIYHAKQQKMHYEKYFPRLLENSRFVPFGADTELFLVPQCQSNENYLLSIGYAKRDWATLMSAYNGLPIPRPDLKILGTAKPIPGALPKGVSTTGRVSFKDMIKQISAARFIVIPLPYIRYAVGQMTVLQSMAMGKAVVVSKVPSMIDYITDGHDGIFYAPADVDDLREKLRYLIENPTIAESIGKNARITIEGTFNEREMAKAIWYSIIEIINSPV